LDKSFVVINEPLARKLGRNLATRFWCAWSVPAPFRATRRSLAARTRTFPCAAPIGAIVSAEDFGAFQLTASQVPPDSVFVNLADLQTQLEMDGRVNALLNPQFTALRAHFEEQRTLEDFALKLKRIPGEHEGVGTQHQPRVSGPQRGGEALSNSKAPAAC
jgi:putative ABC transport system permease protein